jgi:hypothetical protein
MKPRKRYLLFKSYPESLPADVQFLFQDKNGYVFKSSVASAEEMKRQAILVSGSIKKLKAGPKMLKRTQTKSDVGMK